MQDSELRGTWRRILRESGVGALEEERQEQWERKMDFTRGIKKRRGWKNHAPHYSPSLEGFRLDLEAFLMEPLRRHLAISDKAEVMIAALRDNRVVDTYEFVHLVTLFSPAFPIVLRDFSVVLERLQDALIWLRLVLLLPPPFNVQDPGGLLKPHQTIGRLLRLSDLGELRLLNHVVKCGRGAIPGGSVVRKRDYKGEVGESSLLMALSCILAPRMGHLPWKLQELITILVKQSEGGFLHQLRGRLFMLDGPQPREQFYLDVEQADGYPVWRTLA